MNWRVATVVRTAAETAHAYSIYLDVPDWPGHLAGQHVDVRLTAPDGYQAERSYSIASAPEDEMLMLTVERLDDGEVSPYLVDELHVGDTLELRGPIGGYFIWQESLGGPLLLLAGGSGIVPLRAILRHRVRGGSGVTARVPARVPARLLYSARSVDDLIYRQELAGLDGSGGVEIRFTLTRAWPAEWGGYRRRVDEEMLREVAWPVGERPLAYICGPTAFVETAANGLVELGHEAGRIRTERFGPTGG